MYYSAEERANGGKLVVAAAMGRLDAVQEALKEGADIHFEDDLALRCASYTDSLPVLKFLAENGANIQAMNNEALLYAARHGDVDMTEYLLGKGADAGIMLTSHQARVDLT